MSLQEMPVLGELPFCSLYKSSYCRLCGEENNSGINLFKEKLENKDLITLINLYLPLSIQDDGKFPVTICPGCLIHVESTVSFFDLVISGQQKLRDLLNKNEISDEHYLSDTKELSNNLFGQHHLLQLKASGIEHSSPKKNRGRPRKIRISQSVEHSSEVIEINKNETFTEITENPTKRKRKFPARFEETVNGKELEDIYVEEGLITSNERDSEALNQKEPEVIGQVRGEGGQGLCDVVINANNQNTGNKQRTALLFRCEVCETFFNHEFKLHKHYAEQHNIPNFILTKEIDKPLTPVINEEESEKKNRCTICNKKFRLASSLKGHMLSRHSTAGSTETLEGVLYPCDNCDKIFFHLSSLTYHKEASHSNGKLYACNKCDKTFKHRQLLRRHQSVHSDVRAYFCQKCNSSFKTKANLFNHEASHKKDKKFICSICGQLFVYKTSLTLHLRSHTGQKPFECAVCQKRFTQKGNLKEHIRTHTGEKPYSCQICDRKFTTSSQYKLHYKRHMGDKPWKCGYCDKAFLHKNTWLCHVRRHRGEKPFQCHVCFKSFPELWALKKHARLHTGEKPYACSTCNRTFSDCSNLKKHKNVHLKQNLFDQNISAAEMRLIGETGSDAGEQVWSLVSSEPDNVTNVNGSNEQIIYLTLQNSDSSSNKLLSSSELDPLTTEKESEEELGDKTDDLSRIFMPAMQVVNDQDSSIRLAANGTLFQIVPQVTAVDGSLQLLGGNTSYPLAISADGEQIIHQIKPISNIPLVTEVNGDINLTSTRTDELQFMPDHHLKLIYEQNSDSLSLPSQYLGIV